MSLHKKIISIFFLLAIITSVITVRAVYVTNNRDTQVEGEKMTFTPLTLSSVYQTLSDTTNLKFSYHKKTDVFVVTDKRNNYSWKTGIDSLTPKDVYRQLDNLEFEDDPDYSTLPDLPSLNDMNVYYANSSINVSYIDENFKAHRLASADKEVEKTYETTKEDSNVFAVTYDFSNTIDISVKVVFKFSADGISVSIPDENITGEDAHSLLDIRVFPFLGATGGAYYKFDLEKHDYDLDNLVKDDLINGYSVIPDGSGALVRFRKNTKQFKRVELPVYGVNPSNLYMAANDSSEYLEEQNASLPMFGMSHGLDQNAYLAYSEASSSPYMSVVAEPYGLKDIYYYYTYAKFTYNYTYYQIFNQSGAGSPSIRADRYHFDINMNYKFICGVNDDTNNADYIAIANEYKKDVLDKQITNKRNDSENMPIRLDFLMADAVPSFVGSKDSVLTNVHDVNNILTDVMSEGITNINSGLIGYQNGGVTLQSLSGLSFDNAIGSGSDYKKLTASFAAKGVDISFVNDYYNINSTQVSLMSNAARHTGSTYDSYTDKSLGNKDITTYNYLKSSKAKSFAKSQNSKITKHIKSSSVTINGVSNSLVTDEAELPTTAINNYVDLYSDASDKFSVNAIRPNSYLLPYVSRYLNANAFNSQYLAETDSIPLIPYILRDYMEVYADYSNFSFYDIKSQLRMIDYNISPSFILTEKSSHLLINSNSNEFYSTEYELYKNRIKDIYSNVNSVIKEVYNAVWLERSVLAPGVVINKYDNNHAVIINYTGSNFTYNGQTIEALSSKVV